MSAALLFGVLSGAFQTFVSAGSYLDPAFYNETVGGQMNIPIALDFTPDGRVLVAEKGGAVRVIDANGNLLADPLYQISDVNNHHDRGLLGIAVDPNFSSNGYIYLSYTYDSDPSNIAGKKTARVMKLKTTGNSHVAGSEQILLGSVGGTAQNPSCHDYQITDDCIPSDSLSHTIGGIRFGADGKLYVSTGDGAGFTAPDPLAFLAQDIDSLAGKLIRINTDGSAPSDNPFYNGDSSANRSKVWAYGLRNPYRFNFRPGTNQITLADVGWFTKEEVNIIQKGGNYGWPCREGTVATVGGYTALPGCPINTATIDPIHDYDHNGGVGAVTGGAYALHPEYPADLRGNYLFGDFSLNRMQYLDIDNGQVNAVVDLSNDADGPVEFKTSPDGYVYYISIYTGEVRRIRYQNTTNPQPPAAIINATGFGGAAPYTVTFDGTDSTDPNGDPITSYQWNLGNSVTSTAPNPSTTYNSVGTYSVSLTVTNNIGESTTTSRTISVVAPVGSGADMVHVSSTNSPTTNYVGTAMDITTTFRNDGDADTVSLYMFIMDQNYDTVEDLALSGISFAPGESKDFSINWLPPGVGPYYYWVGAFSGDWAEQLIPVESALDINVLNRNPGGATEADVQFSSASAPASAQQNSIVDVDASFTNLGTNGAVIVNLEIYDSAGNQVQQEFFENVTFAAGESQSFSIDWNANVPEGTYYFAASTFSSDWSELLQWVSDAAVISITDVVNPPTGAQIDVISGGTTAAGWDDDGVWNTAVSTQNGEYAFTYAQPWAGVYFHRALAPISPAEVSSVNLRIRADGSNAASNINLDVYSTAGVKVGSVNLDSYITDGSLSDGQYHSISIPISAFALTDNIGALVLQDQTGLANTSYTISELSIRY